MTPTVAGCWALVAIAAAGTLGFELPRALRARAMAVDGLKALTDGRRDAAEVLRLRASVPAWLAAARTSDQTDRSPLTSRVTDALAAAGLPPAALASLSPESDAAAGTPQDTRMVRRRATATVLPVTLPALGSFLDAWRRNQPAWAITRLELSAVSSAPDSRGSSRGAQDEDPRNAARDVPLRAVIVIERLTSARQKGLQP